MSPGAQVDKLQAETGYKFAVILTNEVPDALAPHPAGDDGVF